MTYAHCIVRLSKWVTFPITKTPRYVPLQTYASEARCGEKRGITRKKGPRNSQGTHRVAPGSRRMFTPAMPFRSYKYIWPKNAKRSTPLVAMGIESTNDSALDRDLRGYSDDDTPFCCLAQPPVWSRLLLRVKDHFAFCLGSSIQNVSLSRIAIVEVHTRSHGP